MGSMFLFSSHFLEVSAMTEERRLLAAGMPLEDAISNCCSMRRDGSLPAFVAEQEHRHKCQCNGNKRC